MKITGIILVFLASSFTGVYFSNKYKKRVQTLEKINSLIINTKILIEAQSLTIEELFALLDREKKLDGFFITKDAFLSHDYKRRIKAECKKISFLSEEDKSLFCGFINELGVTFLEGQIAILDGYIKQFENKITELKSVQGTKCRMYNSFGVLIGVFLSIVLS